MDLILPYSFAVLWGNGIRGLMRSLTTAPFKETRSFSGQRLGWKTTGELGVHKSVECDTFHLQCSDAVDWVTVTASDLQKAECWYHDDDILPRALHVLQLQLSQPSPSSLVQ